MSPVLDPHPYTILWLSTIPWLSALLLLLTIYMLIVFKPLSLWPLEPSIYPTTQSFIQQIPTEHLCLRPELDIGWSIRQNTWSNGVYILLGRDKQWITILIHSLKINTMTSYSIAPYKCFQSNHPKRGRICQEAELLFLTDWEINKVIHLIKMKSPEPNNACSKGGESGLIFWWETCQRFCW